MNSLYRWGNRVYHFVVPHVDSSMGISLLVWNEFPIKVIVVPSDENIPRLHVFENVKYVVSSYVILLLHRKSRKEIEWKHLDFAKPGEELCPDVVEELLHGSIIPQFFGLCLDGRNGYLAVLCPASNPLMK